MASYEPGSVLAGKYRIDRVLGEGGMGVVLAARHLGLDEMVAVKLIKEERAQGSDAIARFQREARAAARIKSEHVARVLDVDRLPEGDPYIVMELIDGTDLHALVNRRGRLAPDESAGYIVQACEGLAEAHALGMVHRDLKLKNLFLTQRRDGRALIKVIDFGVVKLSPISDDDDPTVGSSRIAEMGRVRVRDATLTSAAVLVGSVHYMAPEQIRASNVVDARADVWSLGVCLYVMLTGALPFDGNTVAEVCAQIQGRPPIDVRQHAPHLSAELAAVVVRTLEKDNRRRYQSVAELSAALASFHADQAALSRIETILESGIQSRDRALPRSAPSGRTGPEHAATVTHDMAIELHPGVRARVESTIDAAAVGSLAPSQTSRRSPLLTGGILMLAAAGITVALYIAPRRAGVQPEPPAAAAQPLPTPDLTTAMPTAQPMPIPTTTPTTTAADPVPAVTSLPSARATRRGRPLPKPQPQPAAGPKTDPKPEPTGAYDRF